MSEIKITLPKFDGKPDSGCYLWELRLQAVLESKNLWHVTEPLSTAVTLSTTTFGTQTATDGTQTGQISAQTTEPQTADGNQTGTQTGAQTAPAGTGGIAVSAGQGSVILAEHKRKAAATIINGLGDKPLRVVASNTKEPKIMVQKLRERYASTKLYTRMSLLAELHNLRDKSGDMGEYVDKYAALLERLTAMAAEIPQELATIMFLNSMQAKFEATVAALRTMGDEKLTWNDVTARMIEEAASSSNSRGSRDHSAMVTK
jgi:gag-polypeptide of LTR copia-type